MAVNRVIPAKNIKGQMHPSGWIAVRHNSDDIKRLTGGKPKTDHGRFIRKFVSFLPAIYLTALATATYIRFGDEITTMFYPFVAYPAYVHSIIVTGFFAMLFAHRLKLSGIPVSVFTFVSWDSYISLTAGNVGPPIWLAICLVPLAFCIPWVRFKSDSLTLLLLLSATAVSHVYMPNVIQISTTETASELLWGFAMFRSFSQRPYQRIFP